MLPHQSTIAPGAQPYLRSGKGPGILMIHGLGGSGDDFRMAAEGLYAQGWSVSVMRVAGHGMTWKEAAEAHVEDWRQSVDQAIDELRSVSDRIVILGSSFGGALALDAVSRRPDIAKGIIAVNTPLSYRVGGAFQQIGLYLLRLFTPVFPKPGLTTEDKKRYATSGSLPAWPISLILESKKFLQQQVRPSIQRIRLPLLHIENSNDPYVGKQSGSEIDTLYGGPITHIRLSAVTHRPFRDQQQTQSIIQEILAFEKHLPK